MKPTFRQLQYIVAVADEGRFGVAAKRLNVSQPSLSAQIAEAEAHLGLTVFERGRRGAWPTPGGQEVVRRARLILSELSDLRAVARKGGMLSGRVRLGVLPSIGPYLLSDAVRQLHSAHPDLRLAISEASTRDLDEALRGGRLDLLISTPEDHAGEATALFTETLWACVAPDDPLAATAGPLALSDLGGRTLLTLGLGHHLAAMVQTLAGEAGAHVSEDYKGASLDAIRLMAASGAGVAILPSLYAMTEARRGDDIALRPIADQRATRQIALIRRAGAPLEGGFETMAAILRVAAAAVLSRS